jgi:3-oxoacyl-[acyl-carrier-protein] synthase-3
MLDLRILSLGTYSPRRTLDNAALVAAHPELGERDLDRVGVLGRAEASEDEDVPEMAVRAARTALTRAEVAAETLDFLLLVNWSERRYVPDVAPRVQELLGARRAFAFDLGCACAGFVYALSVAQGYLQNPRFSRGLVVASDHSRRRVRPGSRASLLFGDGAAAAVVTSQGERGFRFVDYELGTDGAHHELMDVDDEAYLVTHVRQRELNELAVASLLRAGRSLLARHQLTFEDVDYIVPHSGTAGIQGMLAEVLSLPRTKILTNLPSVGNLTAASIPTALEHFLQRGPLRPGQRVLVLAVGVGWHFVAGLVEL